MDGFFNPASDVVAVVKRIIISLINIPAKNDRESHATPANVCAIFKIEGKKEKWRHLLQAFVMMERNALLKRVLAVQVQLYFERLGKSFVQNGSTKQFPAFAQRMFFYKTEIVWQLY